MSGRVLAVIGGGSAYAPGLLAALLHHRRRLELAEVRLYDLDAEKLELVARLGARMAEAEAEGAFAVTAADTLAGAVRGADAVLNSSRPGGFECRRLDETVPLEEGVPGQETVGPGGFFFALRSVPAAMQLCDAIAAHAPGAVLLNYTNPTNVVTQAVLDRGGIDVIGLCDQSDGDLAALAAAAGQPGAACSFRCAGLNHATWYSDVEVGGRTLAELPARIPTPAGGDLEHRLRFWLSRQLARRTPGLWPNSYWVYYQRPELFVALSRRRGVRTDAILAGLDDYYAHFSEEAARPVPRLRKHRGDEGFGDLAVRALVALGRREPTELVLNLPGGGASGMFSAETVIETHFSLGSRGARAVAPPAPPREAEPLLRALESYQRLTAAAARSGRAGELEAALAENPLVGKRPLARALIERAKARYGARIPVFQ